MGEEHNEDEGGLTKRLDQDKRAELHKRAEKIRQEVHDMQEGSRNVQTGNVGSRSPEDYKKAKSA